MHEYLSACLRLATSARPLVVFDLETTGLIRPGDPFPRIWQIGAIRRDGSHETRFERIVQIGQSLPSEANLRGIDPSLPDRTGKHSVEVLSDFAEFIDGAILAGHRVQKYDCVVLLAAYEVSGLAMPVALADPGHVIDTWLLADLYFRALATGLPRPPSLHLSALGRFFNLPFDPEALHDAMADVTLNAALLDVLLVEIERRRVGERAPRR